MIKIGIILDCEPNWGGSFQYAMSLFEAVHRFADIRQIEIIAFYKQPGWVEFLNKYQVNCINITGEFIKDIIKIDSEGCGFVVGTAQMGWSGRLSTPVIEPIHDLMHRYEPQFAEVSENGIWEDRELLFSSVAENAEGILVDSNEGAKHVKESYGYCYENKIFVLPFAAPHYLFEAGETVELPFERYFFYPAQFWTHKNHINIVRAVAELRDRGVIVNFIFVGFQKNGYDEVISLIEKFQLNNQIQILGYVSDSKMKFLYEKACALIMPTYLGPTNIPPIEAITLGCPVAVSSVYGMPEQLGDAAVYFDPTDVNEIASVMNDLWYDDSLRQRLIENGRDIAYKFTQDSFNKNFEQIGINVLNSINKKNRLFNEFVSFCRKHKRLFLYGAGEYAYKMNRIFEKLYIYYDSIIVLSAADNQNADAIFNKKIKELSGIDFTETDGIVCAISKKHTDDVMRLLREKDIKSENVFWVDGYWLKEAMFSISGIKSC